MRGRCDDNSQNAEMRQFLGEAVQPPQGLPGQREGSPQQDRQHNGTQFTLFPRRPVCRLP